MIKIENIQGSLSSSYGTISVNKLPKAYLDQLVDLVGKTIFEKKHDISKITSISLEEKGVSFTLSSHKYYEKLPSKHSIWEKIDIFHRRIQQKTTMEEDPGLLGYQKNLKEIVPKYQERNLDFLRVNLGVSLKEASQGNWWSSLFRGVKGLLENFSGKKEVEEAGTLSDPERLRGAYMDFASSNLAYLGYACLAAEPILQLVHSGEWYRIATFSQGFSIFSGASSILVAISSSYRLYKSYSFRAQMDQIFSNAKGALKLSEKEKALGVLRFLHDQIYLTQEEELEIEKELEGKGLSTEEKKGTKQLLISKALRRKVFHFCQKMGSKAFYQTIKEIKRLEQKVLSDEENAIQEVKDLVNLLKEENDKKCLCHVLILLAAVIGIFTTLIVNVAGVGIPFLLVEILSVISLSLSALTFVMTYIQQKQMRSIIEEDWKNAFLSRPIFRVDITHLRRIIEAQNPKVE